MRFSAPPRIFTYYCCHIIIIIIMYTSLASCAYNIIILFRLACRVGHTARVGYASRSLRILLIVATHGARANRSHMTLDSPPPPPPTRG
jgi:hypothetical protein